MADKSAVDPALVAKIQRKQQERDESFTQLRKENVLDKEAQGIVGLPVNELMERLQSRSLSARQVLRAYTAKALEVTAKFNCVTEFIPQATEWASALDSDSKTPLGALHGLPVAIKEDYDVEGMDTTLGFAKLLYKPVKEHAVFIKILLKLGAVPFAKVNFPQSLFSSGSENPIFGTTVNCHNVELAPGGSSSGSGCIVAACGAPLSSGSDIGGSLRIPAIFHGVASLRPTISRVSDKGQMQCLPTIIQRGVPGFVAPNAETLAMAWKAILENNIQNEFDLMAMPIPWNENMFSSTRKLKVGYYTSLPVFPAFADVQKTVLAAKSALEAKGYELVPFELPDTYNVTRKTFNLLLADQGKYLEEMFAGEPVADCMAEFIESLRAGNLLAEEANATPITRNNFLLNTLKTSGDLMALVNERRAIVLDILDRMREDKIDLLLGPAYPFPAVTLKEGYGVSMIGVAYTVMWNFVDFPAGVVRFGVESGTSVDSYDDEDDPLLKRAKEGMAKSAGMPINVQVVGPPFKEELVLRLLVELEKVRDSK